MNKQPDTIGKYEIALANAEKGIVSIPCHPGTKIPCVRWKRWQNEMPPEWLLQQWFDGTKNEIAIITNGLVIFDVDDQKKADLVIEQCGETPYWLRSPSGGEHFGFRKRKGCVVGNHVKIKGMGIDIKAENGLAMIPPSRTRDGAYEWLGEGLNGISGLEDLPVARIGWTRKRTRKRSSTLLIPAGDSTDRQSLLYRGQRYIDTFDQRAESGKNGHTDCFVAALKIVSFVRRLGGSEDEAWQLLLYFNATKCNPPWDLSRREEEEALKHKLNDALRLAK